MLETMYAAPGVGLAATQVDVHKPVLVIDVSDRRKDPLALHQPGDDRAGGVEGRKRAACRCRAIFDKVTRAQNIRVRRARS